MDKGCILGQARSRLWGASPRDKDTGDGGTQDKWGKTTVVGMQNEAGIQAGLLHLPGNLHMGETWFPEHPDTQKTDAALVCGHSHKLKQSCVLAQKHAMCQTGVLYQTLY